MLLLEFGEKHQITALKEISCLTKTSMSLITTLLDGTLCNRFECQIAQEWAVSRAKEHQDTLLVRIK
ncbi:hypothetical protein RB195_005701 [Necator americanus]|uniref:Uncharacterized protein n=1 Tax=Necator americanus TaxID=51031 RepID=A0ABR1BP57_NECAM